MFHGNIHARLYHQSRHVGSKKTVVRPKINIYSNGQKFANTWLSMLFKDFWKVQARVTKSGRKMLYYVLDECAKLSFHIENFQTYLKKNSAAQGPKMAIFDNYLALFQKLLNIHVSWVMTQLCITYCNIILHILGFWNNFNFFNTF